MRKYKMLDKNEIREQTLYHYKNDPLFDFDLCDLCDGENCNIEERLNGTEIPIEECFQPMREMYDEEYALEG